MAYCLLLWRSWGPPLGLLGWPCVDLKHQKEQTQLSLHAQECQGVWRRPGKKQWASIQRGGFACHLHARLGCGSLMCGCRHGLRGGLWCDTSREGSLRSLMGGQSHGWDARHRLSICPWSLATSWGVTRTRSSWKCHQDSEGWVTCRRAPGQSPVLDLWFTWGRTYSQLGGVGRWTEISLEVSSSCPTLPRGGEWWGHSAWI